MKLSFRNVNLDFSIGIITLHLQFFLGSGYLGIIAAFIGKFSVAAAFGILYLYTAELYPTQVRNIGVGMCSLSARLGGIMAPLVLLTVSLKWMIVCVCVCVCA